MDGLAICRCIFVPPSHGGTLTEAGPSIRPVGGVHPTGGTPTSRRWPRCSPLDIGMVAANPVKVDTPAARNAAFFENRGTKSDEKEAYRPTRVRPGRMGVEYSRACQRGLAMPTSRLECGSLPVFLEEVAIAGAPRLNGRRQVTQGEKLVLSRRSAAECWVRYPRQVEPQVRTDAHLGTRISVPRVRRPARSVACPTAMLGGAGTACSSRIAGAENAPV